MSVWLHLRGVDYCDLRRFKFDLLKYEQSLDEHNEEPDLLHNVVSWQRLV
jgi:hypothetical protein